MSRCLIGLAPFNGYLNILTDKPIPFNEYYTF
jgi:hypothetical protein